MLNKQQHLVAGPPHLWSPSYTYWNSEYNCTAIVKNDQTKNNSINWKKDNNNYIHIFMFSKLILPTARGFRKECIQRLSWKDLHKAFNTTGNSETTNLLFNSLDAVRKGKLVKTVKTLNFKHSSRKTWYLMRKLSSDNPYIYSRTSRPILTK